MSDRPPTCAARGCREAAEFEAVLYDVYPHGEVFFERDHTCPFLCAAHMLDNEAGACGDRRPRGFTTYPHTNRSNALGFTIYRPLSEAAQAATR
jgi:hypothetical protein